MSARIRSASQPACGGLRLVWRLGVCLALGWSNAATGEDIPQSDLGPLRRDVAIAKRFDTSDRSPPLLVHFHGAPSTVVPAFHSAGLDGVLLVVNCDGLSSVYRKPFENPSVFPRLLEATLEDLVAEGPLNAGAGWGRVDVSFFSAGYGAARELLKQPGALDQIAALVSADSIYASIRVEGDQRSVDAEQMAPFVAFAKWAVAGEKAFLWTHSQLPVDAYASTVETSDYLLQQVGVERGDKVADPSDRFAPISRAERGRLAVLGYPGDDGEAHLAHLRRIELAWRWLAEQRRDVPR